MADSVVTEKNLSDLQGARDFAVPQGGKVAAGNKVAVRLAYRGGAYSGWQRQPNANTVQAEVERGLSLLLGERVAVVGASRTDRGVHALAQWIHLELPRSFPLRGLVLGVNSKLPEDIRLLSAQVVAAEFHAQRCALWKRYRYRLGLGRIVDPLRSQFVARMDGRVGLTAVQEVIPVFCGEHDFSAFAKSGGAHDDPVRIIKSATAKRCGDELVFEFCGNGFLRGMVRAIVGTLVEAGLGRRTKSDVAALLKGGERADAGVAAPAKGLILESIEYSEKWFEQDMYRGDI